MKFPQATSAILLLLLHAACCPSRGHIDTEEVTTPEMHPALGISQRVLHDELQHWTGTQKELLALSENHGFVISKCGKVLEQNNDGDVLEIFITVKYVGENDLFPGKGNILQVRDKIQGLKLLQPRQTSTSQDYQDFEIDLSSGNVSEVSYIAILDPTLALDGVNISLPASIMRVQSGPGAEIATSTFSILQVAKFQTTTNHGLNFVGFVVAFVMVGLAVVSISILKQTKCLGTCSKSTENTQVQQGLQSACSASVCTGEGQLTSALASLVERLEREELNRERKQAVDMLTCAILETFGKTVRPTQCLDMRHADNHLQAYAYLGQLIEKFDIPQNSVQHALRLLLPLQGEKELQELFRLVHPHTCSVPKRCPAVAARKERMDEAASSMAAELVQHVRACLFASCKNKAKVDSPRRKQRILKEGQLQPARLVSPRHSYCSDKTLLPPSQLKHSEPSMEGEAMVLDTSGTQERIFVFRPRPQEESKSVNSCKKKKRNFLNYKSSNIVDVTT